MKIHTLIAAIVLGLAAAPAMADPTDPTLHTQSFGFFSMFHPELKEPTQTQFVQQFRTDYAALFKSQHTVHQQQFVDYSLQRLESLIAQRREMSLKQAHVRFGVLNSNKDQHITLQEFQSTGLKSFANFDQNQDGLINAEDLKLAPKTLGTHDGLSLKTPLAMPMANNIQDFIELYGQTQGYVTLASYLLEREAQFVAVDQNHDWVLSEDEYVTEFMQRYDANLVLARQRYQEIFKQQFALIAKGKASISSHNLQTHAQDLFKFLDRNHNGKVERDEL
jgi:Ca2+-binding EF-hand superfamily protein